MLCPCSHLHKFPLPHLEDSSGLLFVPVDVMDLVVVFKVLIQLRRAHQQEHGLESLRAAKEHKGRMRKHHRPQTVLLCAQAELKAQMYHPAQVSH